MGIEQIDFGDRDDHDVPLLREFRMSLPASLPRRRRTRRVQRLHGWDTRQSLGREKPFRKRVCTLILGIGAVFALVTPAPAAEQARHLPMTFEFQREGPADSCGTTCRTWISAVGVITADTPRDFAKFAASSSLRGATIVLNSEGGSVHGAMALGRAIRAQQMVTTVGQTVSLPRRNGEEQRARLLPSGNCESMCVFVLLGGVKRFVPPRANALVHQIWPGDRRDQAAAASYSADDVVLVHRDVAGLAKYTIEMGGSIDLLEIAARVPPWEPMHRLTDGELARMGLNTMDEAQLPLAGPGLQASR